MADTSDHDDSAGGRSGGRRDGFREGRAGVLLVVFVVLTVIALGKVHGTGTTAASASGPSTSASSGGASSTTGSSTTVPPSTTSTTHPPSSVAVLVANATSVGGAAAAVSSELQVNGWSMLPAVNASARVDSSHVYYVAGHQQQATEIAQQLHIPASSVVPYTTAAPIGSIGTAEVVVVVGTDLAGSIATTTTT